MKRESQNIHQPKYMSRTNTVVDTYKYWQRQKPPYEAEINLWKAVIERAVMDLSSKEERILEDAVSYFLGPVFKLHCLFAGYDHSYMMKGLINGGRI